MRIGISARPEPPRMRGGAEDASWLASDLGQCRADVDVIDASYVTSDQLKRAGSADRLTAASGR